MTRGRGRAGEPIEAGTLALVMAGGNGTRLGELTRWHAKPALPFGGQYRNVDFPLSNCINSGIRRIALLTQYKAHSLIQHAQQGWSFLRPELGEFLEIWPAQQRRGAGWYAGTADAVYQNIDLIEELAPSWVLVLAGDHVYRMDYRAMIEAHVAGGADITVGCVEVPIAAARDFGVMSVDASGWVRRFDEKPDQPTPLPRDPGIALASMGIYVFARELLVEWLSADALDPSSRRDFGKDVLPKGVREGRVLAHAFRDPRTGKPAYWRDVGTLDAYWRANMELLDEAPEFDLYDECWPLWTHQPRTPPPRFIGAGTARRSIVSGGCTVAGSVERSLLSPECRVEPGALVEASVVLPQAEIGRHCRIRNAIVDSGVQVPEGTVIGHDACADAERFEVSAGGVVLVTAAMLERASVAQPQQAKVA